MWGISYFKLDSLKERKFAFQRIKFAFQRIKFASKESSCCKVVVSSVVHRNNSIKLVEPRALKVTANVQGLVLPPQIFFDQKKGHY